MKWRVRASQHMLPSALLQAFQGACVPAPSQCLYVVLCLQGALQQACAAHRATYKAHKQARAERRQAVQHEHAAAQRQHKAALRSAKPQLQRQHLLEVGAAFAARSDHALALKSAAQQEQAPAFSVAPVSPAVTYQFCSDSRHVWTEDGLHPILPDQQGPVRGGPSRATAKPWRQNSQQRRGAAPSVEIFVSGHDQVSTQRPTNQRTLEASSGADSVPGPARLQPPLQVPRSPSTPASKHRLSELDASKPSKCSPASKASSVLADVHVLLASGNANSSDPALQGYSAAQGMHMEDMSLCGQQQTDGMVAEAATPAQAVSQQTGSEQQTVSQQAVQRSDAEAASPAEHLEVLRLQLEADLGAELLLAACTCLQQGAAGSAGEPFSEAAQDKLRQVMRGHERLLDSVQRLVALESDAFC